MNWLSIRTRATQAFTALLLVLGLAGGSFADAINTTPVTSFGFTTSGQIGSEGVTGFNAISFKSQADPIWGTTGSRYLGQFLSAPMPPGVSTTYNNTPFSISLLPLGIQYNDTWYTSSLQPVVLKGRLNGTVSGAEYSSVVASFDPVNPWADIVQGGLPNANTFLSGIGPILLKGGSTTDATMTWQPVANPAPVPVPEPSTIAIFASGLAIAWLGRSRRQIGGRA